MNRRVRVLLMVLALTMPGCNSNVDPGGRTVPALSRVAIADTEGLAKPLVGNERVYIPTDSFPLDPQGPEPGLVAFRLLVIATEPQRIQARLTDSQQQMAMALTKIDPPAGAAGTTAAADVTALDEGVQAVLTAGSGVYWLEQTAVEGSALRHRLGFAIPRAALGPGTVLHVFASETAGGAPLGGDHIELVESFFYMVAIGDSAMWGNGLRPRDKFTTLVARTIEEETGRRVIRIVHALSGATIVPAEDDRICTGTCNGEVPSVLTSITLQAQSIAHPEAMDLILLDGCGNDIGLDTILAPFDNTAEIEEAAQEHCLGDMANLLLRVRALAPQTPLVVTGYFPFLSMDSDVSYLGEWAESRGFDLGEPEDFEEPALAMVNNSTTFHAATTAALASAVALVSDLDTSGVPIAFVDPGFGPRNAAFAADAWLWGLTDNAGLAAALDLGLKFVPEDPLLDFRVNACLDPDSAHGFLNCVYASAGHPNPKGARAYATAISAVLRDIGVLPSGAPAE